MNDSAISGINASSSFSANANDSFRPIESASDSAGSSSYSDSSFNNKIDENYSMLANYSISTTSFNNSFVLKSLSSTKSEQYDQFNKSNDLNSFSITQEDEKENCFGPSFKCE